MTDIIVLVGGIVLLSFGILFGRFVYRKIQNEPTIRVGGQNVKLRDSDRSLKVVDILLCLWLLLSIVIGIAMIAYSIARLMT